MPKKSDNLYEETIPIFIRFLGNLSTILDKGNRFAKRKKGRVSEKKLLEGRLAPDMYTFIQQIGYAYFMALETACNLTGKEMPVFTYDEKSVKELQTSLRRSIAFLRTIKPRDIASTRGKRMKTFLDPTERFSREMYVRTLALPNFFFHVTTAYDIFRHLGVPLKKDDYLGV
ncbi:MAG: DUF1993 domain-containing protein [Candidatus Moraniibacteriota bacterium]